MIHRRSYVSTSSYKKVSGLYKRIADSDEQKPKVRTASPMINGSGPDQIRTPSSSARAGVFQESPSVHDIASRELAVEQPLLHFRSWDPISEHLVDLINGYWKKHVPCPAFPNPEILFSSVMPYRVAFLTDSWNE
jgi:hypothetical protein